MIYFIDLFCGAGGVTEGVENARNKIGDKIAKVIYCVNHDPVAIASHTANHPDCEHAIEDIRTFDVSKIVQVVEEVKANDPDAIIVVWASIDCTQHSKAKGNLPKDADSRTLAWDLYPYIDQINPDYLMIENVKEFMKWGALDENNMVIKEQQGIYYDAWVESIQNRGYRYEFKVLNSADYGAYQSRERLFIIFARGLLPISFPKPTHSKKNTNLAKWMPVRDVLDLHIEGSSIFTRKYELSERTKLRILAGVKKHLGRESREVSFVKSYYSKPNNDSSSSIESPSPTITTIPHQALITAKRIEDCFIMKYLGNNVKSGINNGVSVNEPCVTITTQSRLALIKSEYMMRYNTGDGYILKVDRPSPTILTKDTVAKVSVEHFILNPQWGNQSKGINEPCFTIIARTDKAPPYLVQLDCGNFAIEVYETDSPTTKELKKVMAEFGIIDIKFRMFLIPELKRIQGFRDNYILTGTKELQKKHIGNAVHTIMAQRITESIAKSLTQEVINLEYA